MVKKILLIAMILIGVFILVQNAENWTASTSRNLTYNPNESQFPHIAREQDGGTAYLNVIYMEGETLYRTRSVGLNQPWEPRQKFNTEGEIFNNPYGAAIATDGQYVHMVMMWRADSSSKWQIFYSRSSDYGANWTGGRCITDGTSHCYCPDVVARGQYVHICYVDDQDGNWEIYYKRIPNYGGGEVFLTRRLTYSTAGSSWLPRIAVTESGGTVSIVYVDDWPGNDEIFYKRILSYGAGAVYTRRLTFSTAGASTNPDIVTSYGESSPDDQYVFVVYQDDWPGNQEIFFKRISDYGAGSIDIAKRLTFSSAGFSDYPSIDYDASYNTLHIGYEDNWPGNHEVFLKRSENTGSSFTTHRITFSSAGWSGRASVGHQGRWTHIVYIDSWRGPFDIFYKYGY